MGKEQIRHLSPEDLQNIPLESMPFRERQDAVRELRQDVEENLEFYRGQYEGTRSRFTKDEPFQRSGKASEREQRIKWAFRQALKFILNGERRTSKP